MKKYSYKLCFALGFSMLLILWACNKDEQGIGENPYAGGKEALGIKLSNKTPFPEAAFPGEEVVFSGKGLLAWCKPELNQYEFEFYLADEKVEIKTATDTSITIIVPSSVSSGNTYLLLKGQVFYGPNFNVLGNVKVDTEYGLKTGTTGPIFNYLEAGAEKGTYYLIGGFNMVGTVKRGKFAYVNSRGVLADLNSARYTVREPLFATIGVGGINVRGQESLSSLSYFNDGKALLSGTFNYYEISNTSNSSKYAGTNNIVVLKNNMALDTMNARVLPSIGAPTATTVAVPRFNGGTLQPIIRSFVTAGDQIIAVGNVSTYTRINYSQSTAFDFVYEYKNVASVLRMKRNGDLDETYRSQNVSGAGNINDAYMDEDGGVVVVGGFSTFDGKQAHSIVRLAADGNVDESYSVKIGSGANGSITMVRYNKTLGKAIVVGNFTQFNGQPRVGMAILNRDGSLDETFVPKAMEGGNVNFATILNNEKIVMSGTFLKYAGVSRPGFLILDKDGASTQRFNVPGTFTGQLYQAVETKTTIGTNGLLLMGDFSRFNGQKINNVVMLGIDFNN